MSDREYWARELEDAQRELEAATKRNEVDAAAKRLQRAKSELKALEARPNRSIRGSRSAALPHDLIRLIDHETRLFKMFHDALG